MKSFKNISVSCLNLLLGLTAFASGGGGSLPSSNIELRTVVPGNRPPAVIPAQPPQNVPPPVNPGAVNPFFGPPADRQPAPTAPPIPHHHFAPLVNQAVDAFFGSRPQLSYDQLSQQSGADDFVAARRQEAHQGVERVKARGETLGRYEKSNDLHKTKEDLAATQSRLNAKLNRFRQSTQPDYSSLDTRFSSAMKHWTGSSADQKKISSVAEQFSAVQPKIDRIEKREYQDFARAVFDAGIDSLNEAAESPFNFSEPLALSEFQLEMVKSFADITLGLVPGVSLGKDAYEAISGHSFIDDSELDLASRSFAVLGVASLGGSNYVKALFKTAKVLHAKGAIKASLRPVEKMWRLLDTSAVKPIWQNIRERGQALTDLGYKVFKKEVPIANPLPKNGVFSRVMDRKFAEDFATGKGHLSRVELDEAFIGAYEDIAGLNAAEVAKKLSLYTSSEATHLKSLEGKVAVTFKFKDEVITSLRSPYETPDNLRRWGFIPGGKTAGGAREWLIDGNAMEKGIIDPASIVIKELSNATH